MNETLTLIERAATKAVVADNDTETGVRTIYYGHRAQAAVHEYLRVEVHRAETAEKYSGNSYDWSMLNLLVSADAAVKFWAEVVAVGSASKDDPTITLEAVQSVVAQRLRRILRGYDDGTSTDPMSNAIASIENRFNIRIVEMVDYDVTVQAII